MTRRMSQRTVLARAWSRAGAHAAIAAVFVLGTACSAPCDTEEEFRVASADGKLEAIVFRHDCGGTADHSTHVTVLPAGARLGDRPGDVLISDIDHNQSPRASWGGPLATLRWRGMRRLVVSYHPSARVSLQVQSLSVKTGWFKSEQVTIEFARDDHSG